MSDVSKTNEALNKLAMAAEDAAGGPPSAEQVDALIDYSDALREALERSQRGGATLGEIIKQQCEDIVKITRSEDLILPDGDGDYETVWERAFKMRADLAALEAATRERDAALAAVEVTRKLHHKITRYGNDYYSISAESYEDDPSSYDDLEPFDLCAECYEVERLICEECGGDAPIGHRSSWPCPTVAALDGAPEPAWEYGLGNRKSPRDAGIPYPDEAHVRWLASALEETPTFGPQLMRRRKAGPWLPVEGESK